MISHMTHLELYEEPLQLIWNALGGLLRVTLEPPAVQGVPELWSHIEGLQ